MPRKPQPWFRFYVETPRDPKIRRLAPAHRWVWAVVLCVARESPLPGFLLISERLPMSTADLADLAAVKESEAAKALAHMEQLGLIERDDALGCLVVPKFSARQYESDSSTERSRKHRSKNDDATLQQRSSDDDGTRSSRGRDRARPTENREQRTEVTTQGGNRTETLRPVDATKPPPTTSPADARCASHQGVPDPGPCNGCRRERERAERHAERFAEQLAREAEQRARTCPMCEGTHFVLDADTKQPTRRKCDHRRTA